MPTARTIRYREAKRVYSHAWHLANKEFHREKMRKWRAANPDKYRAQCVKNNAKRWVRQMLLRYKVTVEEFEKQEKAQGGVCAICKTFTPTKRFPKLVVDHDHKTGKFRALLCNGCNGGLGLFRDDITYMKKAIAYLESFQVPSGA